MWISKVVQIFLFIVFIWKDHVKDNRDYDQKESCAFFFSAIAITFYCKADDSFHLLKTWIMAPRLFLSLVFASLFHHSVSQEKHKLHIYLKKRPTPFPESKGKDLWTFKGHGDWFYYVLFAILVIGWDIWERWIGRLSFLDRGKKYCITKGIYIIRIRPLGSDPSS